MSHLRKQQKKIVTQRSRRQTRTRAKIQGTESRPRLSVFRSNKHIFVQIINDVRQHTLVSACDAQLDKKTVKDKIKKEVACLVGKLVAEKALLVGIKEVVFDRGAYKYHGRVRALAEGARKGRVGFLNMFENKRHFKKKDKSDDLIRKVIKIRRVSKKTKGGNRMGFTALVAVGDGKGRVGVSVCYAKDVYSAIKKSVSKAKGKMREIRLVHEHRTIPHCVEVKRGASHVLLRPASAGTGIILGGAMRAVAEAAGIKNVVGKNLGTRNRKNTADAMMVALAQLKGEEEKLVRKKRKTQSSKLKTTRPHRPGSALAGAAAKS